MPEILAPAGGAEQLLAAVRCGADAVYLGAGGFNARQNAENFGDGKLADAVAYCRVRGVDVHVALNTLVMDAELDALKKTVEEIAAAGADAVIVQDIGVMARLRDMCPTLARHASTQMTVHNLDGAKLMADMGFSRVVLSRELTLKEIENIAVHCGIETEVFIHGALCMCMSGACYLSSMLGGRSGNRGYCAQPCRLNFKNAEREYALSLKDMSHISHIRELADAGVSSFKIEGRMKRPEYVAAAVTACRKALAGEPYDEQSLRAVFSRSGFTDGYLTGRRDVNMFGARGREDVAAAAPVLGRLSNLYRTERQSIPVDIKLTATSEDSRLEVECCGERVELLGEKPERARNRPLDAQSAGRNLEKTGGTPYFVRSFEACIEDGLTLPVSALNAMRREALEKLTALRARPKKVDIIKTEEHKTEPYMARATALWGRFETAEQAAAAPDSFERVILPITELHKNPRLINMYGGKLIGELPPLSFDGDGYDIEAVLSELADCGLTDIICDNLYGIRLGRRLGLHIHGGAGLNIMNTAALGELETLGLQSAVVSFELAMNRIAALGGTIPRGIIAYGRLPLMRFRNCPARRKNGCGDCEGISELTDRRNISFPILCGGRRFGTLLNSVPLHIADRRIAPVDFLILYFTLETAQDVKRTVREYEMQLPAPKERTGGLYYRSID